MHRYLRVALGSALAIAMLATLCGQTFAAPGGEPGASVKVGDSEIISRRAIKSPGSTTTYSTPGRVPAAAAQPMPAPRVIPAAEVVAAEAPANALATRVAIERDKKDYYVQQQLDLAREHMRNGDYASAEQLLLRAKEVDPTNREVRAELRDVQAWLGRRPATAGDMLDTVREMQRVKIDEQRTKAAQLVNMGQMHLTNRRFDDAIEAFERAEFIIESSPYSIDWAGIDNKADQGLKDSQRMKRDANRAEHRSAIEDSLSDLAEAEEQQLIAEQQHLERILGSAIEAFNRDDFETAEFYAAKVLETQPDNTKARDLQMAARRAFHDQLEADYLRREKRAFQEWMVDIQNTRVLQDKILKWPSQSFWDRITEVRKRSRTAFGASSLDPEAKALKARVKTTNVTLQIDEQAFQEVVKLLQLQTGINIHIDPRIAMDVGENPVSNLYVEDLPLATVLDLLTPVAGEDALWDAHGNVIVFTTREHVKRVLSTEIHNAADLTTGLTDFIPPTIQLVSPDMVSDEERPLFGAEGEEPVLPYGTIDELIELIKQSVAPGFWEDTEGADIRGQGNNMLVVTATSEMQGRVESFLNDLRGFSGIVVTVETRFLEVGDYFLRDVGVDFRGTGGQTPGTLVNLDDVTNGLEDQASAGYDNGGGGLTTGAALNPASGIYFDDGTDGDFRGRTENVFDNSLGTVLSSLGGSTFTFSYLDDTEIGMVLRATEKTADAKMLTAPRITVYNTQRANLTVVNQLSYIQDFDVEVAQTSFIADPIVGIIQDGLTLDVRPTVSNDRRYITLELQPTVADLVEPIPTFATTLASTYAPVIIQLPELRVQQARVTVRIPDRGSILIGGLKNISTEDRASEVPWIARVPILSFFFSRKGRSDEVSHLMIIVRAEITDLQEQENQMMGGGLDQDGPFALPPSPFHTMDTPSNPCNVPMKR